MVSYLTLFDLASLDNLSTSVMATDHSRQAVGGAAAIVRAEARKSTWEILSSNSRVFGIAMFASFVSPAYHTTLCHGRVRH